MRELHKVVVSRLREKIVKNIPSGLKAHKICRWGYKKLNQCIGLHGVEKSIYITKQSRVMDVGQSYFLPYTLRYDFDAILDIGMGPDTYIVDFFIKNGKTVYAIDTEKRNSYRYKNFYFIKGNFLNYEFDCQYDAVWASHVLEHVQDTGHFLNKVYDILKDDGIFFCIVPPHKTQIVGGHVTIGWNIGILMYNFILCGFNVKEGRFKKQGYNIVAFVKKRRNKSLPESLDSGNRDIEKLRDYWPDKNYFKQGFEGDLSDWNWFKDGP